MTLERDLVQELRAVCDAYGAFLVEIGQWNAKKSGSTVGVPDLAVLMNGRTIWVETKRAGGGRLSLGQQVFAEKAAERGVHVFVIDRVEDFVDVLNAARRSRGVERRR